MADTGLGFSFYLLHVAEMRSIIKLLADITEDKRIDFDIRKEYVDKLEAIINVEEVLNEEVNT